MRRAIVIQAFPYAFDGINVQFQAKDADFPPAGQPAIADSIFDGLVKAGYIKETDAGSVPEEEMLNRDLISALDKMLSNASDQDLKGIIARSGTPYSGNMVRAHLVLAAKRQMVAEAQGQLPITGIDPNAGVTEQPLAAPGAPTPPSAAAAVEQQKAADDAAKGDDAKRFDDAKREDALAKATGENKPTDQFGAPLADGTQGADISIDEMTVAELKDLAEKRGVDLGDATKKAEIIEAIKAADKK